MAKNGLKLALPFTLGYEGGVSNHPDDPGGLTFKGVTQKVYNNYRRAEGLPTRPVTEMTETELQAIYDQRYYRVIQGDRLPAGLDFAVFDFAVNSGPAQAAKELQRVLGVGVDGHIGDETVAAACAKAQEDEEKLIADYCARRLSFMKKLKNWKSFKTGWTRRVMGRQEGFQERDNGVIDIATMIARKDIAFPVAKSMIPAPMGERPGEVAASAKALPSQTAILKTNEGKGAIATIASAGGGVATLVGAVADQASKVGDKVQVISDATGKVVTGVETAKPLFNATTLLMIIAALLLLIAIGGTAWMLHYFTQRQREKFKPAYPDSSPVEP